MAEQKITAKNQDEADRFKKVDENIKQAMKQRGQEMTEIAKQHYAANQPKPATV